MATTPDRGPIVLAFSGGLDTSFCIPWLVETCGRPVVTVTVDTGGLDAAAATELDRRARQLGASDHLRVDARRAYFDRVLRFLDGSTSLREDLAVMASAPRAPMLRALLST